LGESQGIVGVLPPSHLLKPPMGGVEEKRNGNRRGRVQGRKKVKNTSGAKKGEKNGESGWLKSARKKLIKKKGTRENKNCTAFFLRPEKMTNSTIISQNHRSGEIKPTWQRKKRGVKQWGGQERENTVGGKKGRVREGVEKKTLAKSTGGLRGLEPCLAKNQEGVPKKTLAKRQHFAANIQVGVSGVIRKSQEGPRLKTNLCGGHKKKKTGEQQPKKNWGEGSRFCRRKT